jgi:hypothetical protein
MAAYLRLGSRLLILSVLVLIAIINHPVKAQSPQACIAGAFCKPLNHASGRCGGTNNCQCFSSDGSVLFDPTDCSRL